MGVSMKNVAGLYSRTVSVPALEPHCPRNNVPFWMAKEIGVPKAGVVSPCTVPSDAPSGREADDVPGVSVGDQDVPLRIDGDPAVVGFR